MVLRPGEKNEGGEAEQETHRSNVPPHRARMALAFRKVVSDVHAELAVGTGQATAGCARGVG